MHTSRTKRTGGLPKNNTTGIATEAVLHMRTVRAYGIEAATLAEFYKTALFAWELVMKQQPGDITGSAPLLL